MVQREQAGLIVAETNREWHAVLQESHERDLNGFPCSIHVTELYDVDRALECGSRADRTSDEYIATVGREQEQ